MPVTSPVVPVVKAKHRRIVRAKVVPRTLKSRVDMPVARRAQGWVVLTTWEEQERPRVVFAVTERVITSSYAAVPTAGGWLVIQL